MRKYVFAALTEFWPGGNWTKRLLHLKVAELCSRRVIVTWSNKKIKDNKKSSFIIITKMWWPMEMQSTKS